MRNTTRILFSGALISVLTLASVAQAEDKPNVPEESALQAAPQTPDQAESTPDQVQPAPEAAQTQDPLQPDMQSGEQAQNAPAEPPAESKNYDVNEFFSDAQRYSVGDLVPEKYRSKPYEIVEWQKRHLPAPEIGSHWTYMGGNYVLITDGEGKIMQIKSGEIFFR
ncbi:RcnB family protein [Mixta tenebrionis]|nr:MULTISPECIES: RcnB family protein [Mixta]QHM76841.1 Nickel/cobalt homeostasis protein RcnB [Mixta theicola]